MVTVFIKKSEDEFPDKLFSKIFKNLAAAYFHHNIIAELSKRRCVDNSNYFIKLFDSIILTVPFDKVFYPLFNPGRWLPAELAEFANVRHSGRHVSRLHRQ